MLEAETPLLRSQLLAWWQAHGRREPEQKPWMVAAGGRFPDPGESLPPYGIWIAEVMLQQTQVAVMRPYWLRWMGAVPSLEALAATPEQDLLLL